MWIRSNRVFKAFLLNALMRMSLVVKQACCCLNGSLFKEEYFKYVGGEDIQE